MTTVNGNVIKEIASSNKMSELIFSDLHERQRIRKAISMEAVRARLAKKKIIINYKDFQDTFDKMVAAGLGVWVYDEEHAPLLKLNYNLQWITDAAQKGDEAGMPIVSEPETQEEEPTVKRRRGRPVGSRNVHRQKAVSRRGRKKKFDRSAWMTKRWENGFNPIPLRGKRKTKNNPTAKSLIAIANQLLLTAKKLAA